jgi:hypothetical protein
VTGVHDFTVIYAGIEVLEFKIQNIESIFVENAQALTTTQYKWVKERQK